MEPMTDRTHLLLKRAPSARLRLWVRKDSDLGSEVAIGSVGHGVSGQR